MSAPIYPGTPAPPARPTVVTISSYLLYLSTAVSIIAAIVSLTAIGTIRSVYASLYSGTASTGMESIIVAATVVGVVLNILFAATLSILAIYNNRGRQPARITTWVLGGIYLCCSGFGLLSNAATSGMNLDAGNTSGPSARQVEERLAEELPGWFTPISTTLSVLVVLSLLGALILLALPAANAYFRKPQVAWDPMNPYPGYPGAYPGYPSQSPYPAPPGQQYPPQPGQQYPPQPGYPPQAGQQYPPQGYPAQPYPAQPGQGYPGQPPQPQGGTGDITPPPGSPAPTGSAGPAQDPTGGEPHTGSVPPTDPWSAPSPPSSPPSPSSPSSPPEDKPGRSPTDPA